MQPFDADHLTEPEQAVQQEQEQRRDCRVCAHGHAMRSGFIQCTHTEAPDTMEVMAGFITCEYFRQ